MSAHTRPIRTKCLTPNCRKRATVEVFNTRNASLGCFCPRCASLLVGQLLAREKAPQA